MTRVQVFPDVMDVSYVLTTSGIGALLATFGAAVFRLDLDRLARVVVFGTLAGATVGIGLLLVLRFGVGS